MMVLSAVSVFAMHSAEININDTDLELATKLDMGQFNRNIEPDTVFLGAKFLNADAKHSSEEYADIDPYYELNFLMQKEIQKTGMHFGLGVKLNYTKDYSTLPLGVEFAYTIPAVKLIPMHIGGALYYAPAALAFSEAKDFLEYRLTYDIEIIDNGGVVVGYRHFDTNYKDAIDFEYNRSFYVGFKFRF